MKNLLIIGDFHHKNKEGLIKILENLKFNYKFGNEKDIDDYDLIYSPCHPINTSLYPNKKFIFGPHFSVFPEKSLELIKNVNNNSIYIQPSTWASNVWINMNAESYIPIKTFAFPVNTNKFTDLKDKLKTNIFIYFKRRNPEELKILEDFVKSKNNNIINYRIFNYCKRYDENDYINYLQTCKYGIILDAHESQGFAVLEALSCNVPLLVWKTNYMMQEYGSNYSNIPCTTIPYWNDKCGEYFSNRNELESTYEKFIEKLNNNEYNSRQYILDNLSLEKCSDKFLELINF